VNRLVCRFTVLNPVPRKVNDHDAVLLHDAHQHEHADECVERCFLSEHYQRQQPADEGRGKS
jgi:hypothetical protein